MQPIFKTSRDLKPKHAKKDKKKRPVPTVFIDSKTGGHGLHGLTEWAGTSHAVIKKDRADKRMFSKSYSSEAGGMRRVDDAEILVKIRDTLKTGVSQFTKSGVKHKTDSGIDLLVYTSVTSDRILTIDERLSPPDKLFAPDDGIIAIDSRDMKNVSYMVAIYTLTDVESLKKKLGDED